MVLSDKFVLAVDGGQSSTLALLAQRDGTIIAAGRGGPSNHYNEPGGPQRLESALRDSTADALKSAGQLSESVSHICLGMSGIHIQAKIITEGLFPNTSVELLHDAVTALAGASIAQPGVIVIAGTGAVAYGRLASGEDARSGGWGYLIGDEGSGYWIGIEAIRMACQASDGRGEATMLVQTIPEALQLDDLRALHRKLYAHELERGTIASLSTITAEAARAGDAVAAHLLERAGQELGQAALAVIARLGQLEPGQPIYHTGGVFRAGDLILKRFEATIAAKSPNSSVHAAAFSPSVGALLLALRAAGVELTPAVIERVRRTLPQDALLKRIERN
ncbi:MAG TPA: BadF/BadG/BcrA/BcrD ATPase family protein [Phototrophicaceae bacterium]|nr:BadF/BadG/BcrA/BcrD ATPase family protein [Phototrophicaceae bacterium]